MNTPADSTLTETDTRPGEVRTYRGRTVEELIPQIRAELGPATDEETAWARSILGL